MCPPTTHSYKHNLKLICLHLTFVADLKKVLHTYACNFNMKFSCYLEYLQHMLSASPGEATKPSDTKDKLKFIKENTYAAVVLLFYL